MMRITFMAAIVAATLAGGAIGHYAGQREQAQFDRAEALKVGAGFYGQSDGVFRFGVPPVVMTMPTLDDAARALPVPQRKPQHH